ncbi:hypothetical protein DFJ58DRAFT_841157 [Suillus subalutaceus]|uniref:uncharacterized protein n=1 Tax=Suillus subalutaceus TaxID=48586 RepID=UPI001B8800ED|nr:uncharacterized protein DFJ58DRAFT_841157 [Suillus subalutaceus]KAG1855367.1 hypothetical protein DFJ58DRAFT_841157 [Suillus subalutaceus]
MLVDESESNSDGLGSESESGTSDSSSESSDKSEESETDKDRDDEDQHSHVQTCTSPPSDSSDQPSMQAQLAMLEVKVKSLEFELHSAKAHCAMALSKVGLMKKQLNKWQKKTQARNINARWLTSAEGLQQCEEQDVAREAKAQKKAEAAAQKASRQANIRFITGALSTKSKENLINIVNQLKIETTGTKAELLKAIREYFDSHTNLKNDV